MKTIKTIIVDDEPLYAWEIEQMLDSHEDFEVIGVFNEASKALSFLNTQNDVDLLIVDIHLEGSITGVELVKQINRPNLPIVFVTQDKTEEIYNEVKEIKNYSYLVKPFHKFTLVSVIRLLLSNLHTAPDEASQSLFSIRIGNKREVIEPTAILWIESSRNHCTLHTTTSNFIVRKSLKSLIDALPKDEFVCIHKSFAVNLAEVKRIELKERTVFVRNTPLPLGRNYVKEILSKLTHLG